VAPVEPLDHLLDRLTARPAGLAVPFNVVLYGDDRTCMDIVMSADVAPVRRVRDQPGTACLSTPPIDDDDVLYCQA
jgi:hypothetical protein